MNRLQLYNKTVDVLYNAYFNDKLEHGSCTACAVGNICLASGAHHAGTGPLHGSNAAWKMVFITGTFHLQHFCERNYNDNTSGCKDVIDRTGYSPQELAAIEFSFETANAGYNADDYMFNGLVAVLDTLKKIHEVDDNIKEVIKFKQHYETLS